MHCRSFQVAITVLVAGCALIAASPTPTIPQEFNKRVPSSQPQARSLASPRPYARSLASPQPIVRSLASPQPLARAFNDEYISNAKRLALGLPLNKPHRRTPTSDRPVHPSAVPPATLRGHILVTDTEKGIPLGYISSTTNDVGEFGFLRPTVAGALELSFKHDGADAPSEIDLLAINSPFPFPYFGGILDSGSPKLGHGAKYIGLGSIDKTSPGSRPAKVSNSYTASTGEEKLSESAIWAYDPFTRELSARWINTYGSSPATSLAYVPGLSALVLVDDPTFKSKHEAVHVAFKFVPA